MKICRECGFIKSNNYTECPDCDVELDDYDDYEGEEE